MNPEKLKELRERSADQYFQDEWNEMLDTIEELQETISKGTCPGCHSEVAMKIFMKPNEQINCLQEKIEKLEKVFTQAKAFNDMPINTSKFVVLNPEIFSRLNLAIKEYEDK